MLYDCIVVVFRLVEGVVIYCKCLDWKTKIGSVTNGHIVLFYSNSETKKNTVQNECTVIGFIIHSRMGAIAHQLTKNKYVVKK